MRLILTEKPSVAKDIALALSPFSQEKGYLKAQDYIITWALGHLLEISDENIPKKWQEEDLPILPDSFSYIPKNKERLSTIRSLIKQVNEVIIATDAGREGQLIAELILSHVGWRGKTYRLWSSEALTREVVLRELKNLRDNKEFESLYACALARQHSDWIVGINLTRMATLKSGSRDVWSVGRVQTPTLALIVKRDLEIESFKPVPYAVIKAVFNANSSFYEGTLLRDDLISPQEATKILQDLSPIKEGTISRVEKQVKKEPPPLLHSLTSLQREANEVYSFSAEKTLSLAQSLYEKGYISYPRSDARHLSESSKDLTRRVLKALNRDDLISSVDKVGKRVFDDSKLTDHHAIIPLRAPEELSDDEKKVYDLILRKFLGAFMDEYIYELTTILTSLGKEVFVSRSKKDLSLGWKSLYTEKLEDSSLPELRENLKVKVEKLYSEKHQTKPPPHYTDSTILATMEKLSLGTPATRASIIETLKHRGYIKRESKSLKSTPKGRELIEKLKDSQITKPELTSIWEVELESIYKEKKGFSGYANFVSGIKSWVRQEIETLRGKTFEVKDYNKPKRR